MQRISIRIKQSRCVILTRESLSRKSPVYIIATQSRWFLSSLVSILVCSFSILLSIATPTTVAVVVHFICRSLFHRNLILLFISIHAIYICKRASFTPSIWMDFFSSFHIANHSLAESLLSSRFNLYKTFRNCDFLNQRMMRVLAMESKTTTKKHHHHQPFCLHELCKEEGEWKKLLNEHSQIICMLWS